MKVLLASHGPLAQAMKETAGFLLGEDERVHCLCAYVDDDSQELPRSIEQWLANRDTQDTWVVITDIFGGSVNNEFLQRVVMGGYHLLTGMSLPLLVALLTFDEAITPESLQMLINETKEVTVYCNPLMTQSDIKDDEF